LNANNTNNNTQDNVYDADIMTESLQEFSHSSDECRTVQVATNPQD